MKRLGKYNDLGCVSGRGVDNIHFIDGITFLTDQWQHSEYYSAHILAKQGERGHLQGGITVLLKPWMAPIISTTEQNHSLLLETKYITILAAYFQPNQTAIDIIVEKIQLPLHLQSESKYFFTNL